LVGAVLHGSFLFWRFQMVLAVGLRHDAGDCEFFVDVGGVMV
jgi:hypothetical protein